MRPSSRHRPVPCGPSWARRWTAPRDMSRRSVHEVGLLDLTDIARLTRPLPQIRALVVIQPPEFGWGDRPGEPVAACHPPGRRLCVGGSTALAGHLRR